MTDQKSGSGTGGSIDALRNQLKQIYKSPYDFATRTYYVSEEDLRMLEGELAALLTQRDQPEIPMISTDTSGHALAKQMTPPYPWDEVRANYWSQVRQFFTKDAAGELMAVCSAAAVNNARQHDDQQIAELQRLLAATQRDAPQERKPPPFFALAMMAAGDIPTPPEFQAAVDRYTADREEAEGLGRDAAPAQEP